MKIKQTFAVAVFLIVFQSMFSVADVKVKKVEVTDKNKVAYLQNMTILKANHYEPHEIDDSLSVRVHHLYLHRMDYNKRIFLQSDIDKFAKYKYTIDDLMNADLDKKFEFYIKVNEVYNKRISYIESIYEGLLAKPFDYTKSEVYQSDAEKSVYCKSLTDLKDRWRKMLKYQVALRYIDIIEMDNPDSTKNLSAEDYLKGGKIDSKIEAEAREKIANRYKNYFRRINERTNEENFAIYVNAILNAVDPHTTYMPPKDKEDFDIDMTGKFEGIGASLTEKDGYIKVTKIIPGSASWRQKELEPEDVIIKVAQGDEEPLDVVDLPLSEAVQHIRGKKGTEVRLTVKKPTGEIKVIPIIRDVVVLEETYAKDVIIKNDKYGKKYGYIYLPKYYRDFQDRNAPNATDDVKKALLQFKNYDVDGVILDLRNNGGGALVDAIGVVGLFIPDGPMVQVNDNLYGRQVRNDRDFNSYYDGPLVVLVNQLSASASEITSAALQDYERAVILGPEHSFGKGTVQSLLPLDRSLFRSFNKFKPLGSIKLTIQKFYRINGGSTQFKGVIPDIKVPTTYDYLDMGEKDLDYPLKWDKIEAAKYEKWYNKDIYDFDKLRMKSEQRVSSNEAFRFIKERNAKLKAKMEDTDLNLKFDDILNDRLTAKTDVDNLKEKTKEHDYLDIINPNIDDNVENQDSAKQDDFNNWTSNLKKDIYIDEAMSIINDIGK